ncbi:hypothetical protein BDF22DRAFT_689033, partial [Syncephalis plumigaleata]
MVIINNHFLISTSAAVTKTTPPCQKEACDIQSSRCQQFIKALHKCCQQLHEQGGSSPVCPKQIGRSTASN